MPTKEQFEAAKQSRDRLEQALTAIEVRGKQFPSNGPMGLTPDNVKSSPEFKQWRKEHDKAFSRLRAFNAKFVKIFAKQLRTERREKRNPA